MRYRYRWLLTAVVGLLGLVLYANYDPTAGRWALQCAFRQLTGWQCPGCGGQRAVYALLHGHVVQAVSYNLYAVVAYPYALLFVVRWLAPCQQFKQWLTRYIENRYVVRAYIVTFMVWIVVRNVLGI